MPRLSFYIIRNYYSASVFVNFVRLHHAPLQSVTISFHISIYIYIVLSLQESFELVGIDRPHIHNRLGTKWNRSGRASSAAPEQHQSSTSPPHKAQHPTLSTYVNLWFSIDVSGVWYIRRWYLAWHCVPMHKYIGQNQISCVRHMRRIYSVEWKSFTQTPSCWQLSHDDSFVCQCRRFAILRSPVAILSN